MEERLHISQKPAAAHCGGNRNPRRRRTALIGVPWGAALFVLSFCAPPSFGWLDAAWAYRRPIDLTWNAEKATGGEVALLDFYTGGAALADGADVRITAADDRPVPAKVLMLGPGDRVRVAFHPLKGVRRYFAYFGNPKPPPNRAGNDDVKPTAGLLMEMRVLGADQIDDAKQIEATWEKSTQFIGRTIIPAASLGINPFGDQQHTISRLVGTIDVTEDSNYVFAMSADDRGALFADGQPVVYAPTLVADVRYSGAVKLTKGKHQIAVYHVNVAGDGQFAVVYHPGGFKLFSPLNADTLGQPLFCSAGQLEQARKTWTPDFAIDHQGECFFASGYSERYAFIAQAPKLGAAKPTYEWDFGDGQTGSGPTQSHVYLVDGVYAVRLTVRIGANAESITQRQGVSRNWEMTAHPTEEKLSIHAATLAQYDQKKIPAAWLARAIELQLRDSKLEPTLNFCNRLAELPRHDNVEAAFTALTDVAEQVLPAGGADLMSRVWAQVPVDSDLQPRAAKELAALYLWRAGNPAAAAKTLEPFVATGDDAIKLLDAQSLILSRRQAEGVKLLLTVHGTGDQEKHAAISGASARTVEYYIGIGDWQTGEQEWDRWQMRFPSDFLEGYAVSLKAKLMELKKEPQGAANVAQAFAAAVPGSPYSSQLLDRASKLVEQSDPVRAAALRAYLKEHYPEDPLSQ